MTTMHNRYCSCGSCERARVRRAHFDVIGGGYRDVTPFPHRPVVTRARVNAIIQGACSFVLMGFCIWSGWHVCALVWQGIVYLLGLR